MTDIPAIVKLQGITKTFPGVIALEDVDFTLRREIHALVGENGAGKSTLIKVLTGVEQPDKGTIELGENLSRYDRRSILKSLALARFIRKSIFVQISLLPRISCWARASSFSEVLTGRKTNELARKAIDRLSLPVEVTQPLGSYSVAIQQMVAITRALEVLSSKC